MCVGCGQRDEPSTLIRLILDERGPEVALVPDVRDGAVGRGAHVHARWSCLEAACQRGFSRAFKREVRVAAQAVAAQIRAAYERRFAGLLGGAMRGGHLVIGTEAALETCRLGLAKLVLVAADAGRIADRIELRKAESGAPLVVGTRHDLARALGRSAEQAPEGVVVCVLTASGLADEVRRTFLNTQAWSVPTDVRANHSGRTRE